MGHKQKKPKSINFDPVKVPKRQSDPESYFKKHPSWKFSKRLKDHKKWSLNTETNFMALIDRLESFENQTWDEIIKAAGARRVGTNSHFIDVEDLCLEAKKIAQKNHIYEVFSLRLASKQRLFGSIQDGVFYIFWYDLEHEICPCNKK